MRQSQSMIQQALAPATRAFYSRALNSLVMFCDSHNIPCTFPIHIKTLSCFIMHLFNSKMSASSISSYISAISYYHKINSQDDTTKSFHISQLLTSIRKSRPSTDKRKPITKEILANICHNLYKLNLSKFELTLFRCMFATAFYFGLRISEFTQSTHNIQLSQIKCSNSHLSVNFKTFKHSSSEPYTHRISKVNGQWCPVKLMNKFLPLRGNNQGALFTQKGTPISARCFSNMFKQALIMSNICPTHYSSHSFRIGAASLWSSTGKSDTDIRRLGRWKSSANLTYIRNDVNHTI